MAMLSFVGYRMRDAGIGRWHLAALGLLLVLGLPGCGGDSPNSPQPVPSATPTPAPRRLLVAQGSQSGIKPAPSGYSLRIDTLSGGMLEAHVDWTFPSSDLDIGFGQGDCFAVPNCPILATSLGPEKPKSLFVAIPAGGTYSLLWVNNGTSDESISWNVFLTN